MLMEQRGLQLLLAVPPNPVAAEAAPRDHEDEGKDRTGLGLVWQAATDLLCDYLEAHASTFFSGAFAWDVVCELGAGAGVCGMLAARLGARRVVLTDYHSFVLTLLRANVERNGLGERCAVSPLSWSEASTDAEAGLCTRQSLLLLGSDLAPSEVCAHLPSLSPKSHSFELPYASSSMFRGLMSRFHVPSPPSHQRWLLASWAQLPLASSRVQTPPARQSSSTPTASGTPSTSTGRAAQWSKKKPTRPSTCYGSSSPL
jgi:hypothetical protein